VAARSKARKRALDVLFEAELRGLPVLGLLAERMSLGEQPTPEYAAEIVRGVQAHRDEIDKLMADNAVGWTLERMPAVDRNVLRIGVWELLWADDVPDGVAISEAVALAQDLSTDGSPAFVNGLLAKVKQLKPGVVARWQQASRDEAPEDQVLGGTASRDEVPPGEVPQGSDLAGDDDLAADDEDEAAHEDESFAEDESVAEAEDEAVVTGESSATATPEAPAPAEAARSAEAARRTAPARTPRSGRGLVKPPRVAVRPESDPSDS
jgi:N utilization substance protein B